jgi:hypothetical protein
MLHRMALRVLPSLSLAVTEDTVRRRKRVVMFVPGLVAFGVYRLAKHAVPLSEPLALLLLSAFLAAVTSLAAYRAGRGEGWRTEFKEDAGLFPWLAGWIGAFYGVQLSLLVLALLWLVGYSYFDHPDGPAMMAIIISCTAVSRDAFEIGHVRRLASQGRPFSTFPDGRALRDLLRTQGSRVAPWVLAGLAVGISLSIPAWMVEQSQSFVLLAGVTVAGGALALAAYFAGLHPEEQWLVSLRRTVPSELLKYWWWPGMAFASTYYLVAMGFLLFVWRDVAIHPQPATAAAAGVAALMALYGYYLGHRRHVEDRDRPQLSSGMLRCPFVMGILGKTPSSSTGLPGDMALGKEGSKG